MNKEDVKKIIYDWIKHNDFDYDEFENGMVIDNSSIKLMFCVMDDSLIMGITSETIPIEGNHALNVVISDLNMNYTSEIDENSMVLLNNRCKYLLKASNFCKLSKFGLIPIKENGVPCRLASKVEIIWDIVPIDENLIEHYTNILLEEAMKIYFGFALLRNINQELTLSNIETLIDISNNEFNEFNELNNQRELIQEDENYFNNLSNSVDSSYSLDEDLDDDDYNCDFYEDDYSFNDDDEDDEFSFDRFLSDDDNY